MPDPNPLLSAIVINYNTKQMTLDCLRALQADLRNIPSEIILVDNASTDGSVIAIGEAFPDITLIENRDNRGFGAANNQGMRGARGQYFLLINSDAFAKPGAIAAMIQCLNEHPQVGVVGPRLLNADGSMQRSCFRFPSPGRAWLENLWISAFLPSDSRFGDYRRWPHDSERIVDFAIGACLMVRKSVVEEVGGFDEEFFMYSEEADWQKRIAHAGWNVFFTPAALATHLGGASGAGEKPRINQYFFDSLDYYELKHHGLIGLVLVRLAMVIGCTMRAAGWLVCCAIPGRSERAKAKLKLRGWLIWRQMTDWRILQRRSVAATARFSGLTRPDPLPSPRNLSPGHPEKK